MKLSQKLTLLQVSFMGEFLLFALFVELSVAICSVRYVQHLLNKITLPFRPEVMTGFNKKQDGRSCGHLAFYRE